MSWSSNSPPPPAHQRRNPQPRQIARLPIPEARRTGSPRHRRSRARMSELPPDDDELLTVGELCAWFKITEEWVYAEIDAGRLPHVRLSADQLRFRRTDLHLYLLARTLPRTGRHSAPIRPELVR